MTAYPYPYAFSFAGEVDPTVDAWAHCGPPAQIMGEDALDAYAYWVLGREYLRANAPGRLAEWDTKFGDAIAKNDPEGYSFLGTMNVAGLELFLEHGERFLILIKPGLHPETCEIDWREVACAAYWFAGMSAPHREEVLALIEAGTYTVPELVCPPPPRRTAPTARAGCPRPRFPSSPAAKRRACRRSPRSASAWAPWP